MKQKTFSSAGFDRYAKTTKREMFVAEMDQVVPWPLLCGLIAQHYPDSGTGRPAVGLERMLRIYCLQHWFFENGCAPHRIGAPKIRVTV
jgi:IS5 family transposase